jgi:protein-disulfide isomerase
MDAPLVNLEGISQDGLVLGSADAPVRLIEYADFQCPFCRAYAVDVFPTIVEEYVRPRRVQLEYRGLAFLGPDSETALRYALAASLQNRFWQLEDALYASQGAENSGWVTDELVRMLAADVPGLDVDRMFADADGAEVAELIEEANRAAEVDQVPGTPTFFVQIGDDEPYRIEVALEPDTFREALDDALRG